MSPLVDHQIFGIKITQSNDEARVTSVKYLMVILGWDQLVESSSSSHKPNSVETTNKMVGTVDVRR